MKSEQIGAFEAKNHFSELLEKAVQGMETIVTKHGRPVARIVPFVEEKPDRLATLDKIAQTRAQIAKRGSLLNKGESWKSVARDGLR